MDPVTALTSFGGAARWSQLRALGVPERAVQAAVRAERVYPLSPRGYALLGADPAFVAAASLSGVVSHASAARLHGLDLHRPPKLIEVTVARGCRQRRAGVRVHCADLAPQDREQPQPVTSLRRTLCDCGRTMPILEAVVMLDSAVRDHNVSIGELRAMAAAAVGPGSAALRRAVAHVDVLAGSALESVLRLLLHLLGADVESQVWISGVGPVDFVVNGWLVLEADGYEFHSSRKDYRKDRRKANRLVEQQFVLLRFSWEDIRLHPAAVLAQIERVLATGRR